MKACHQLGPITDVKRPPPIIAKFIFFDMKNRIWMGKKLLRGFVNPLNRQPVFLYEHDKDLVDLAEKKGFRVITNNCQLQLLVENQNGKFIPQSISRPKDIDELLCLRNVAKQAPGGQNDHGKKVMAVKKIHLEQKIMALKTVQMALHRFKYLKQ